MTKASTHRPLAARVLARLPMTERELYQTIAIGAVAFAVGVILAQWLAP